MQIQVVSKGIDVSSALRERITDRISEATEKYFGRPGDAFVTIARDGHGFRVDCTLHLPSGALLRTHGEKDDAYVAAEQSLDRLEKRLRRYKSRREDSKRGRSHEETALFTLQAPAIDEDMDEPPATADEEPLVVAETTAELARMTVKDAVTELMDTNAPSLVFRNDAHGGLSVIYRRPDGHIGWIDPERTKSA